MNHTPDGRTFRARSSDPETSHEAAENLENSPAALEQAQARKDLILKVLRSKLPDGLTEKELRPYLGVEDGTCISSLYKVMERDDRTIYRTGQKRRNPGSHQYGYIRYAYTEEEIAAGVDKHAIPAKVTMADIRRCAIRLVKLSMRRPIVSKEQWDAAVNDLMQLLSRKSK
jgi:hypothetical protein